MAQSLVGLDIGQYAIKGVRIARGMGGLSLIDSFEKKVQRSPATGQFGSPLNENQVEAIRQLMTEGKIRRRDRIAVSLPGQFVSNRLLTLPFSDPKKLREVVPYELEATLPFDIDEVVVDFKVCSEQIRNATESTPRSILWVLSVQKTVLQTYLSTLQSLGIDPSLVGGDGLSLCTFYERFLHAAHRGGQPAYPSILFIDIGASKTVLCQIKAGRLSFLRTLPMGADLVTEAIQKEQNLTWEEAERKKEVRLAPPLSHPEIVPLLNEIEQSIRMNGRLKDADLAEGLPTYFYVCGSGGAHLTGVLSQALNMEALTLDRRWMSESGSLNFGKMDAKLVPTLINGIGLALQLSGGGKRGEINFRKGEFTPHREKTKGRVSLLFFLFCAILLVGLMASDLYLRSTHKENRFKELKQQIRAEFVKTFSQAKSVSNEIEQATREITLQNAVGEILGVGDLSPLFILKEMTAQIPRETPIDILDLTIDGQQIRMEAQTVSYDAVDRIRDGLKKSFEEVTVSDAKVTADPSKVRFQLKMATAGHGKGVVK